MGGSNSKNSDHVCFEDMSEKNVKIVYVWVGIRTLLPWYLSGANHWSVILKLDNGQYACVQKHDSGKTDCVIKNSLKEASLRTWGIGDKVRLSEYGQCSKSWEVFRADLPQESYYVVILIDCQDFARQLVGQLTDKLVGVWPIEDGPVFYE